MNRNLASPDSGRTLLDGLAYAAKNGIPPDLVLEALREESEIQRRVGEAAALDRSIRMLRSGAPVSDVLKQGKAPYYLCNAAACAEKNGALPAVLPVLARNVQMRRFYVKYVDNVLYSNIFIWILIGIVLAGMAIFIFPPYGKLLTELLDPEYVGASYYGYLRDFSLLPLVLVLLLCLFTGSLNSYWFEWIYLRLPFLGELVQQRVLYDLSGMFYSLLAGGMDMGPAARAAAASEPRRWVRKRLTRFAVAVESGEEWYSAWRRQIRLGNPMCDWFLHGGAVSGNPAESFRLLQEILCDENLRRFGRLEVWLIVLATLVNAVIVGTVGYTLFYFMTKVILSI